MFRDPVQRPEFALVVGEDVLPADRAACLRRRWLAVGRVPVLRRAGVLAVPALVGLTAGVVAGCGSSVVTATNSFVSCSASGLAVEGGQIDVLSIEGASCVTADRVMTAVIAGVNAGEALSGVPGLVEGWRCVTYDGNQATCTRGHATLYAQYASS